MKLSSDNFSEDRRFVRPPLAPGGAARGRNDAALPVTTPLPEEPISDSIGDPPALISLRAPLDTYYSPREAIMPSMTRVIPLLLIGPQSAAVSAARPRRLRVKPRLSERRRRRLGRPERACQLRGVPRSSFLRRADPQQPARTGPKAAITEEAKLAATRRSGVSQQTDRGGRAQANTAHKVQE